MKLDFTQLYLTCFIAGMLGIFAHVIFVKLPALKAASKAGNVKFSVLGYFLDDWLTLAGSLLTVVILIYILDEVVTWQPIVAKWVKWCFIFVGYTGDSIIQQAFGKTADCINKVIDQKTDIADGKV
jgi:hypothetical protein